MKISAKIICFLFLIVTLFSSCAKNSLTGVWVSDYDGVTLIEFRDNNTISVTSQTGRTFNGTFEDEKGAITIKIDAVGFVDSTSAKYEISEDKLKLIRLDGQIEQFSRN